MAEYLAKRGATYYFRRVIPEELRPAFSGASEFTFSLHTKDRRVAKSMRSAAALETDTKLDEARSRLGLPHYPSVRSANLPCELPSEGVRPEISERARGQESSKSDVSKSSNRRGPTLTKTILELWKTQRKRPPKTIDTYSRAAKLFCELIDRPISRLTRMDVVTFRQTLLQRGYTPGNIRCYLSRVRTLLEIAADNGYLDTNPASGVHMADPEKKKRKRRPFSLEDLQTIFSQDVFGKGLRPTGCGGEAALWLPTAALFTGAREEELGQLRVRDIGPNTYVDGDGKMRSAPCIMITEDEEDDLHLKTAGSQRIVPIHPVLIDLGFLDYVQSLREKKQYWLFPDLKPGAYGRRTAKWCEWFSRFLRDVCGIKDRRKVFYSFRHTFKDFARNAGISDPIQRQLMGHASRDVADEYGDGYDLYRCVTAIQSFHIHGLEIAGHSCSAHLRS